MSYGRFRRFAMLLPPERLTVLDPGLAWFEAATVMPPRECSSRLLPRHTNINYELVDMSIPSRLILVSLASAR